MCWYYKSMECFIDFISYNSRYIVKRIKERYNKESLLYDGNRYIIDGANIKIKDTGIYVTVFAHDNHNKNVSLGHISFHRAFEDRGDAIHIANDLDASLRTNLWCRKGKLSSTIPQHYTWGASMIDGDTILELLYEIAVRIYKKFISHGTCRK